VDSRFRGNDKEGAGMRGSDSGGRVAMRGSDSGRWE